jgi:hypothetical protein
VRVARNVAIILVLALGVAFIPGGGSAADTVLTALTLGFLAGIAWLLYTLSRENRLTLATLSDGRRAILYGALGLIALLIAGTDEMFDTGGGTLAWIVLLGISVAAIWRVWVEANTY